MDRLTKYRRGLESKGDDGSLSFAITLIAVSLSSILYILNYTENNLIPDRQYFFIYILIGVFIVPILNMISYIFVKAVSLELKSYEEKEDLRLIAADYYLSAFRDSIYVTFFVTVFFISSDDIRVTLFSFAACFIIIILLLSREDSKPLRNKWQKWMEVNLSKIRNTKLSQLREATLSKIKNIKLSKFKEKQSLKLILLCFLIIVAIIIFLVILILQMRKSFVVLFPLLFIYYIISQSKLFKALNMRKNEKLPLYGFFIALFIVILTFPGHLLVEMNSVYYKQDKIIPVEITITGRDYDFLYVRLFHTGDEAPYDSIIMHQYTNISEEFLGNSKNTCLCGHYLGQGKYKLFINCSDLIEGTYELSVAKSEIFSKQISTQSTEEDIQDFLNKRVINSFYLVDNNRTLNSNDR